MKANFNLIILISALIVANVILYVSIFYKHEAVSSSIPAFPNYISCWHGEDINYDTKLLSVLSPDKIIYKSYYSNRDYPPITLFIAYYKNLEKADLSHSPVVCFTGQGWEITEAAEQNISLGPSGSTITVNKIYLRRHDRSLIAYYWYQSPDRAFSNRGLQKLYMFWAKILGRSDNNAFIRVTVPVQNPDKEQEMINYMSSFIKALYPVLRRYFL